MPRLNQRFASVVLPSRVRQRFSGSLNALVRRDALERPRWSPNALARRDALCPWETPTRTHSNAICASAKRYTERVLKTPALIIPLHFGARLQLL
jgi:hypothetical protein